jgi:hypothetical protein
MSKRVAKHRIELRVDGKPITVMPGQLYDFDKSTEDSLDARGALEPIKEQPKEVQPVAASPKRGKGKKEESDEVVDELDV